MRDTVSTMYNLKHSSSNLTFGFCAVKSSSSYPSYIGCLNMTASELQKIGSFLGPRPPVAMSTTMGPRVEDLAQVLVRVEVAEEAPPMVDLAQTPVRVAAMVGVPRVTAVAPRAETTAAALATTETGLHLLGRVDREITTQEATPLRPGAMGLGNPAQTTMGATLPRLETMGLATPAQTIMAATLPRLDTMGLATLAQTTLEMTVGTLVAQLSRTESMSANTALVDKATGTTTERMGTAVTVVTVRTLTLTSALAIRMRIYGSGIFL
jgi:hypothetical protein